MTRFQAPDNSYMCLFCNFRVWISAMKKRLQYIDLPPHLEEFRKNYLAATEVEATLCGIITCYKMYGAYFMRSKSSLTGKQVKKTSASAVRCTMQGYWPGRRNG
ncbi:hypothetical protein [Paraflavitalea speifideaquila]|uniref:hypothetical protein n=1 Tax=Paraflavitalea speifideaquila TaxID=3076558 RepID=UPI0028EEDCA7|nr:hypothetical protein [Paraflavitalea speifideiaquila]